MNPKYRPRRVHLSLTPLEASTLATILRGEEFQPASTVEGMEERRAKTRVAMRLKGSMAAHREAGPCQGVCEVCCPPLMRWSPDKRAAMERRGA
jgi:hypothetical protein